MDLVKLYNDLTFFGSFGGKKRFYAVQCSVKQLYPNVTIKEIDKFLQIEKSYVLHRLVG